MTQHFPTAAAVAQQENTAAAGFAVNELAQHATRPQTAVCIGCGNDQVTIETAGRHWLRVKHAEGYGVCNQCREYTVAWDAAHAFGPPHFDLVAHLHRQRAFSLATFGPGPRNAGIIDHIRKELIEIEAAPGSVEEWVDVILLALDGAWRAGFEPAQIALEIATKQVKNERRTWPDWRTAEPGKAIEHVREAQA